MHFILRNDRREGVTIRHLARRILHIRAREAHDGEGNGSAKA